MASHSDKRFRVWLHITSEDKVPWQLVTSLSLYLAWIESFIPITRRIMYFLVLCTLYSLLYTLYSLIWPLFSVLCIYVLFSLLYSRFSSIFSILCTLHFHLYHENCETKQITLENMFSYNCTTRKQSNCMICMTYSYNDAD